ncbi:hypothetical protein [Nocardioides sp. zg-1228]|uniref:hypothetical protein n=1 Tax=Nocardioides sp. zg-1228 TaxID=2763008 RepID=UPI001642D15F|nr:hypothetical protein [Nocardioides sp. zg-1228]MBC2931583.1 hypothetical protein [Nocardioides sp. zg-1228]QSF57181.1 hypothetical protein JX575_16700 [Nocardioides sp. zg-1228]
MTVPNSVYYDFRCIDVPYTYAYTLRPGYELEDAHLEVIAPDGLEAGRDSVTSTAVSGSSEVQICSGEPGAYAGTVDVLACTPNITDCYEFVMTVRDERPTGYFPTSGATVRLQPSTGRVRGATSRAARCTWTRGERGERS